MKRARERASKRPDECNPQFLLGLARQQIQRRHRAGVVQPAMMADLDSFAAAHVVTGAPARRIVIRLRAPVAPSSDALCDLAL